MEDITFRTVTPSYVQALRGDRVLGSASKDLRGWRWTLYQPDGKVKTSGRLRPYAYTPDDAALELHRALHGHRATLTPGAVTP